MCRWLLVIMFFSMNAMSVEKNSKRLEDFRCRLHDINLLAESSNENEMPLSKRQEGLEIVQEYYRFLLKLGEPYGQVALDVVRDEGWFGKIANIHLRTQAVFDGIKKAYLPELQDRIKINLAYRDLVQRIEKEQEFNYEMIAQYHKEIFKSHHLTEYAWGGLAIEEFIGSGKWMDFHRAGFKTFAYEIKNILKNNQTNYSVERMLTSVKHSFSCYVLFSESDYEPTMRAKSSKEVASRFQIELNRVIESEDFIDFEPSMMKTYKIVPR